MGGCWGPDRRERLQNKAEIAFVTDPDRGREWECMGGCWGPVRRMFSERTLRNKAEFALVTDPELEGGSGSVWEGVGVLTEEREASKQGRNHIGD